MELKHASQEIRQWIAGDPTLLGITEEDMMSVLHDAEDEGDFVDQLRGWMVDKEGGDEYFLAQLTFLDKSLNNPVKGKQAIVHKSGTTVQFNIAYKGERYHVDYMIDAPDHTFESHAVYDASGKKVSDKMAHPILGLARISESLGHLELR